MRCSLRIAAVAGLAMLGQCPLGSRASIALGADAPATRPAGLDSYADLIGKCTEYDRLSSNWTWTTIYTADFDPGKQATWHPDPAATDMGGNVDPNAVQTGYLQEQGHNELLVNGQACQLCFLDIGPKVRGDVAIEMLCKSISPQRLNDLSIIFGGFHTGPGFQFGSNGNTKALLWPGAAPDANPNTVQSVVPTGSPQTIQINRWYRIRLEVKDGQVRGLVDGHEIGKIPLNSAFPLDEPHQPFLYCYNSQMVLREVHIEAYARDPHGVDPNAWSKVFGTQDPAQVQTQLDGLVRFLADRDPATRQKAEHILTSLGALAIPALQRAATSDVPELTVRAAAILQAIKSSGKPPARGS